MAPLRKLSFAEFRQKREEQGKRAPETVLDYFSKFTTAAD
jgi:hypothetical protein